MLQKRLAQHTTKASNFEGNTNVFKLASVFNPFHRIRTAFTSFEHQKIDYYDLLIHSDFSTQTLMMSLGLVSYLALKLSCL
ncbi:MAG: hypothetical protein BWX49_00352 [Bacteroidetes bacterium ADurb.Bin008]|jgi:hypothetical protein|nr:MAG: hypothetical protein BWX49_00352 [Bacteroidetes bacterium ADurb.Bin008]